MNKLLQLRTKTAKWLLMTEETLDGYVIWGICVIVFIGLGLL